MIQRNLEYSSLGIPQWYHLAELKHSNYDNQGHGVGVDMQPHLIQSSPPGHTCICVCLASCSFTTCTFLFCGMISTLCNFSKSLGSKTVTRHISNADRVAEVFH